MPYGPLALVVCTGRWLALGLVYCGAGLRHGSLGVGTIVEENIALQIELIFRNPRTVCCAQQLEIKKAI